MSYEGCEKHPTRELRQAMESVRDILRKGHEVTNGELREARMALEVFPGGTKSSEPSLPEQRWCFRPDGDGHVFLVPIELAPRFEKLRESGDDDTLDAEFSKYRCEYHENCYTFTDPKLRGK